MTTIGSCYPRNAEAFDSHDGTDKLFIWSVQKALKEAVLSLLAEEYDWFDIHVQSQQRSAKPRAGQPEILEDVLPPVSVAFPSRSVQKQFFEFAGPLFSVRIIPQSCVIPVGESKTFRAMARDRNKKPVEENLAFRGEILEGEGSLESSGREIAVFTASQIPRSDKDQSNRGPGRNILQQRRNYNRNRIV